MDSDDRWVLAFVAIVGDDRLVPILTKQIKEWADCARGSSPNTRFRRWRCSEPTPPFLAVDALAIRYRSKYKNIGKAAGEAFAEAARSRGLTVEELGDLVVPWLGFEPGTAHCGHTKGEGEGPHRQRFQAELPGHRDEQEGRQCRIALGPR